MRHSGALSILSVAVRENSGMGRLCDDPYDYRCARCEFLVGERLLRLGAA